MAKTIEQIQQLIDNKADIRELINLIADYLQANPTSGAGGASLTLTSPDNTEWEVTINDAGALITTAI